MPGSYSSSARFFYGKTLLLHKLSLLGVAKVLQSEKKLKYWAQWTFRLLKNEKKQTKTHKMGVLESLEHEHLESDSRPNRELINQVL